MMSDAFDMGGCGNGATAEPVRHRQTKGAATDMFDLQPPRHISTLRVSPVAAHSDDRLLSEPTAVTHPCLREPLFMPHTCRSQYPSGSAQGRWKADIRTRFLRELSDCSASPGKAV